MTYANKYSLGIYVNRNFASLGGSGNPHIFLGLKIEKIKCNAMQIKTKQEQLNKLKSSYANNNFDYMEAIINKHKRTLKQMQCFVSESTLQDLRKELSKNYPYTFIKHQNFKAWQDVSLKGDSFNKGFDVKSREIFNDKFVFFRQCYADIAEPFFEWLDNVKEQKITDNTNFIQFEEIFNEFIESPYSNIHSIEGFFGFGPYETGLLKNYETNKHTTGGKVFQNNHWNVDFEKKTEKDYVELKERLKNKPFPRIPQKYKIIDNDYDDKQFLTYSKDFVLTSLRPLKTFQEYQSEVISISENQYKEVCKCILSQTILSSDRLRKNAKIFGSKKNTFKNYKVVGNSCVDFVMDKLQLLGNWLDKAVAIAPYDVILHIQNRMSDGKLKHIYGNPLSKGDKISFLLYDIQLFYQNYSTLCRIDSTWWCEKGLKSFSEYYYNILHSNLLQDLKLNRLGEHKMKPLPRDKTIENITDDIAMHLNAGMCVNAYFQDILKYNSTLVCDVALLYVKEIDNGNKRFFKADSQSDFIYQDFDFASDDKVMQESYNLAINRQQPIIFSKIPHYNIPYISKESKGVYIQSFLERYTGKERNIGDYRDMLESKETHNV